MEMMESSESVEMMDMMWSEAVKASETDDEVTSATPAEAEVEGATSLSSLSKATEMDDEAMKVDGTSTSAGVEVEGASTSVEVEGTSAFCLQNTINSTF